MFLQIKIALFVLVSAALAYVSRRPLRDIRSHGFCRIFAWEAIAFLVLLNLDDWFEDPWAPHQVVSWFLLVVSGFLVVHGVHLLRKLGRPQVTREGDALIGIEKTTRLVTSGAYRSIRHPLRVHETSLVGCWVPYDAASDNALLADTLVLGSRTFACIASRTGQRSATRATTCQRETAASERGTSSPCPLPSVRSRNVRVATIGGRKPRCHPSASNGFRPGAEPGREVPVLVLVVGQNGSASVPETGPLVAP